MVGVSLGLVNNDGEDSVSFCSVFLIDYLEWIPFEVVFYMCILVCTQLKLYAFFLIDYSIEVVFDEEWPCALCEKRFTP